MLFGKIDKSNAPDWDLIIKKIEMADLILGMEMRPSLEVMATLKNYKRLLWTTLSS